MVTLNRPRLFTVLALSALSSGLLAPSADAARRPGARAVAQQGRIQSGVQSGALNRREAARLEAQQARIRRDAKAARSDGTVTGAEGAALRRERNAASRNIRRQKHDDQTRSDKDMSIPARTTRQDGRIEAGVDSGALTDKEAARLGRRSDHIDASIDKAQADGTVTAGERARIQAQLNHQNRAIRREAHDRQGASPAPGPVPTPTPPAGVPVPTDTAPTGDAINGDPATMTPTPVTPAPVTPAPGDLGDGTGPADDQSDL